MKPRFLVALMAGSTLAIFFAASSVCRGGGFVPDDTDFLSLYSKTKSGSPGFDLPESLPGGGVKKFHNASGCSSYEYSQGAVVHVYRFEDPTVAAKDFQAFAAGGQRIEENDSAMLAQQGACTHRDKDRITLWFLLDDSVVGIEMSADKWAGQAIAKTVEEIVRAKNDHLAVQYGTPEKAVRTFVKSSRKFDLEEMFRCLTAGDDAEAKKRLQQMRALMPTARSTLLQVGIMQNFGAGIMGGGGGADGGSGPRVGKSETVNGQVFVPVRVGEFNSELDHVWVQLLQFASGLVTMENMMNGQPPAGGGNEPLWIPAVKIGTRWVIDLSILGRSSFSKTVQEKKERDCFAHMRVLLQALIACASEDAPDQKYPAKLSTLVEQDYVDSPAVFVAPGSKTKIEKAVEADAKSDFAYEGGGRVHEGDGDFIIIYCNPAIHDNRGAHVGFGDGHVQWMTVEEMRRALANQRKNAAPAP